MFKRPAPNTQPTKNQKIDMLLEQVNKYVNLGTDADYVTAFKLLQELRALDPDEKAVKGFWGTVNCELAKRGVTIDGIKIVKASDLMIQSRL